MRSPCSAAPPPCSPATSLATKSTGAVQAGPPRPGGAQAAGVQGAAVVLLLRRRLLGVHQVRGGGRGVCVCGFTRAMPLRATVSSSSHSAPPPPTHCTAPTRTAPHTPAPHVTHTCTTTAPQVHQEQPHRGGDLLSPPGPHVWLAAQAPHNHLVLPVHRRVCEVGG